MALLTIVGTTIDNWPYETNSPRLRARPSHSFVAVDNSGNAVVIAGPSFYLEWTSLTVATAVDGTGRTYRTVTLPDIQIYSTRDAIGYRGANWIFEFTDEYGSRLGTFQNFERVALPDSFIGSTTTNWQTVYNYNHPQVPVFVDRDTLNRDQILQLISQYTPDNRIASDTIIGGTKLSVAAVDPATPIAVGTNDARLNDSTTISRGLMSAAQAQKLAGIAAGATVNSADSFLLSRANHTGTQLSSTISDFTTAVQTLGDARYAATGHNHDTLYSPISHSHSLATQSTPGYLSAADKAKIDNLGTVSTLNSGTGSGNVPVLDGTGKLNTSVLPAIAITDTFVVASQAAMLALTAEVGDVAVRTDLSKSFILRTAGANVLANWQELLAPAAGGGGGGGVSGLTTGYIPVASSSTTLGDSIISATADKVTITGVNGGLVVLGADASVNPGGAPLFEVDGYGDMTSPVFVINNNSTAQFYGSVRLGGVLDFGTDNQYDIGASGANRPRHLYLGGRLNIAQGIATSGVAPTITNGAAAGASPSSSVTGNAIAGEISFTTGTGAALSGVLFTLNVAGYTSTVRVVLTPANSNAAGKTFYISSATSSQLDVSFASGLASSTQYKWHYHVIQ
jgi:hypothetical protein